MRVVLADMNGDVLDATVAELGNLSGVLSTAEPSDRSQLYEALGVTATYDADTRNAVLQVALPRSAKNVSEGGTCQLARRDTAYNDCVARGVIVRGRLKRSPSRPSADRWPS